MSRETDDKTRREKLGIEPTIPAADMRDELGDFSNERRPPDGESGGPTVWVIVALVALVGAGFWWLGGSRSSAPAPAAAPAPSAPAATPAKTPHSSPKTASAPAPTKPAAAPPTGSAAATPSPPPNSAPSVAPAAATTTPSAATTDEPAAAKHPHKRHKKPKSASKHKDVKLPRLPTPPPTDP